LLFTCCKKLDNNVQDSTINTENSINEDQSNENITHKALEKTINGDGKMRITEDISTIASTIKGKIICGYQGWFSAPVKDAVMPNWTHWSRGIKPGPDKGMTIELYPDIREYSEEELALTDYKNFPNGSPAMLYDSSIQKTIDTHFKWMYEYGIDGVALQRFGVSVNEIGSSIYRHNQQVGINVRKAAEKHDRLFYICYDVSGLKSGQIVETLKNNWKFSVVEKEKLVKSPNYLRENGKPIVQIWGVGVKGNYKGNAEEALEIIKWFKEQGCYVIGGVPTNWISSRGDSLKGYEKCYAEYDMISPWTVGRYNSPSTAEKHFNTRIKQDINYCKITGQEYMPVIFPGFAWSKWNGGPENDIERKAGEFMWEQGLNAVKLGAETIYVAMFDEYDEATAIMKAAEDSSMVPEGEYFLTLSADGEYVSSDFYLRLTGEINKMLKSEIKPVSEVPTPRTQGPVFFRTGFEKGMDPIQKSFSNPEDFINCSAYGESSRPRCAVITNEESHFNNYSLKFEAIANKGYSKGEFEFFNLESSKIEIDKDMFLTYWKHPKSEGGRKVNIDLTTKGGKRLSLIEEYNELFEEDQLASIGQWSEIKINIGEYLEGEKIKSLLVTYVGFEEEDVIAYIDDICIETKIDR